MQMWNAQNASHIHTASAAATGLNPMPHKKLNQQPSSFQRCGKVRKNWTLPNYACCVYGAWSYRDGDLLGKLHAIAPAVSLQPGSSNLVCADSRCERYLAIEYASHRSVARGEDNTLTNIVTIPITSAVADFCSRRCRVGPLDSRPLGWRSRCAARSGG